MRHIAAIPTMYNGVQFRSRLEARWAAFFDLCGWQWEYEPFDLNGWIPDFRTMHADGGCLALWEIKPTSDLDVATTNKIDGVTGKRESNYVIHLAGFGPECMWYFATRPAGWYPYAPNDRLMSTLNSFWKEAGNVTQWKSPRTQTTSQQRVTAKFPDFKLWDYIDPTETYDWLKEYYRSWSASTEEWAQELQNDGFSRRAVEETIDAKIYLALADCLTEYERLGVPLKEAKQRVHADKFDHRANHYLTISNSLKCDTYRPHEAAYYASIAHSAVEKAKALRAKIEDPSNFESSNALAENLFREARSAYFKTEEGGPERIQELRERLRQHEDHVAKYGPKERVLKRIEEIETELDTLDPAWCCAS